MKPLFTFLSFSLLWISLPAQIFGPQNDSTGRAWNIRFVLDGGLIPLSMKARDKYQGEQFRTVNANEPVWQWAEWDSTRNYIPGENYHRLVNIRLGVLVNVFKDLYVGVNYSAFIPQLAPDNLPPVFRSSIPFVSLSGSVNYTFRFPKIPRLSLEPTLSYGTYQSDPYEGYEGIGKERSLEGRLALAFQYRKKRRHQVRLWASVHQMRYSEKNTSLIYPERIREVYSQWDFTNLGIGITRHIGFYEDPMDSPKKQRKREKTLK